MRIGQGHSLLRNNWWIGAPFCVHSPHTFSAFGALHCSTPPGSLRNCNLNFHSVGKSNQFWVEVANRTEVKSTSKAEVKDEKPVVTSSKSASKAEVKGEKAVVTSSSDAFHELSSRRLPLPLHFLSNSFAFSWLGKAREIPMIDEAAVQALKERAAIGNANLKVQSLAAHGARKTHAELPSAKALCGGALLALFLLARYRHVVMQRQRQVLDIVHHSRDSFSAGLLAQDGQFKS